MSTRPTQSRSLPAKIADVAVTIANSPRLLLGTAIGLLAASSTAYALAEDEHIVSSVWWSVVTATTVGYGDAYPTTLVGKWTAGLLMVSMVLFFIPMVTASFASRLIVNRDAFKHEEQEEIKRGIYEILRRLDAD